MVKKLPKFRLARTAAVVMGIALAATSFAEASESGILAARAQRSFSNGKFAKGYGQLERALLASRKESDLFSEGRVLINMARIRTISLDLNLADSLLTVVRPEALDVSTLVQLVTTKAAIANARGDYQKANKNCESIVADSLKNAQETAQAAYYSECAIAQAGARQMDAANESLKMVGKRTDKKGGFYAFTAARIADISGNAEADSLYRIAEAKAIQANLPFTTATILYLRSQLKSTPKKEAEDLKLRCKNAFELIGLPNNAKRCSK